MSRALIALPRTAIQKKEQYTADLVMGMRTAGFTEGVYQRPFRVFEKSKYVVKVNQREGIAELSGRFRTLMLKGEDYFETLNHINDLTK